MSKMDPSEKKILNKNESCENAFFLNIGPIVLLLTCGRHLICKILILSFQLTSNLTKESEKNREYKHINGFSSKYP